MTLDLSNRKCTGQDTRLHVPFLQVKTLVFFVFVFLILICNCYVFCMDVVEQLGYDGW